MKKFLIAFVLFEALTNCFAQSSSIQSVQTSPNWPLMLSSIGTSQITSGILYDKISGTSGLINYNKGQNNIADYSKFSQTLTDLYEASDRTKLISTTVLKTRIATTTTSNVDVGMINTSYQKLFFNPDNPSSDGLLFQNGMFVQIPNKPAYISKKLVMIAPLKDIVTGASITYKFRTDLILNNATTTIKTLVAEFQGNTTVNTIISNSAIVMPTKSVVYTTSGMKITKYTITFSDNTTLVTFGYVYVNIPQNNTAVLATAQSATIGTTQIVSPPATTPPCYELLKDKGIWTASTDLAYQGYTETSAVRGQIEYTVFYHTNNGNVSERTLLNPLIIVDGFDPKDNRKVQECDCINDPTGKCVFDNSTISINWSNSFTPVISLNFNYAKYDSLEELMNYDGKDNITGQPKTYNLMAELRLKGYDVIVINNPTYTTANMAGTSVKIDGGADYIERNAMNLVSFIKGYVKTQQNAAGSTSNLVLIGPSMGGQITRFALAYMEKKFAQTNDVSWKHNARLWVSVDSPHLGANIPVGAQASIWFLGERLFIGKAKENFNEKLNSVAGKQQIINQFQNALDTGNPNGTGDGGTVSNAPFFTTYYNNLNSNGVAGSNGYPVSIPGTFRKIAMANGSLTGKKEAVAGQQFYSEYGYIKANWLGFFSPVAGLTALITGEDIKIPALDLNLNFGPAYGQTSSIFGGDGQNFDIGLNHWYISHPSYYLNMANYNIRGSLDVAPGGYFKTAKLIKEDVEKGLEDAGAEHVLRLPYLENHSFISTFSALGHLSPNQDGIPRKKWTNFHNPYATIFKLLLISF
jgi:hypothetical protein